MPMREAEFSMAEVPFKYSPCSRFPSNYMWIAEATILVAFGKIKSIALWRPQAGWVPRWSGEMIGLSVGALLTPMCVALSFLFPH
jgi:hypothetical protein